MKRIKLNLLKVIRIPFEGCLSALISRLPQLRNYSEFPSAVTGIIRRCGCSCQTGDQGLPIILQVLRLPLTASIYSS